MCFICCASGKGYGIYNFSTPNLLREGKGTDLVIRNNVVTQHVISTLYLNIVTDVAAESDMYPAQLPIYTASNFACITRPAISKPYGLILHRLVCLFNRSNLSATRR